MHIAATNELILYYRELGSSWVKTEKIPDLSNKQTLQDITIKSHFLPCDAMRGTVFAIIILSVCLSHSWTVDCVHMVRPTIMISSPYGSSIILVSGDIKLIPKFEGGHPKRGR